MSKCVVRIEYNLVGLKSVGDSYAQVYFFFIFFILSKIKKIKKGLCKMIFFYDKMVMISSWFFW